jgi:predicted DCC family thiol-disulfide oxidoreductase YuxK
MIEVFFDGKCGLCSREIAYYQNIAPSGIFAWTDIATDASPLAAHQISQVDALRHLHVRDAAGGWHIGAAAFLVIWQQLRYWRFLAVLVGLPIIRQIAAMVYNRFADYRFASLPIARLPKRVWQKHLQAKRPQEPAMSPRNLPA